MDKINQAYFTTGEFAKLCNVSKHVLFHYDKVGVFSPAITEENGYRYYSFTQLEMFGVIMALKELDMPLKEIKNYLDRRSPEEFLKLLKQETILLDQKINQFKQLKQLMKLKEELVRSTMQVDVNQMYMENLPDEFFVVTKCKPWTADKTSAICIAEHVNFCEENNIYSPYSIGAMVLLDEIEKKNYTAYSYYYTQLLKRRKGEGSFCKKAGRYLSAYHNSGYEELWKTYEKMLEYAKFHNFYLEGYFFEGVLFDDFVVKGYENYVLKLSIKIKD